ncbi:tetratricopeptide repeat protein [Maribacter sp. LLG6340-A2]|uniref:tetratricopeptide repeat protein n=1 Tax=Maribacter sp. LLG6340-A2 TaxID=3160834 RepID=UPI00386951E1
MKTWVFFIIVISCGFATLNGYAQEDQQIVVEESAEVFLDEYSDSFQENFFEGLKQKGIRNYDRAITYFLECKRMQPNNTVVSYELAKFHLYENQYLLAQEYAIEALKGEPENYWYANTLVDVLETTKSPLNSIKKDIPWNDLLLRKNIAEIYFKRAAYQTALDVLHKLKEPKQYAYLQNRILDSIAKYDTDKKVVKVAETNRPNEDLNSVEGFKDNLKNMLQGASNGEDLYRMSIDAMDSYPTQPYFYYANGTALNRLQRYNEAIEQLETALDFLIDDSSLQQQIYTQLVVAYKALENTTKANMYLSKIKSGS